MSQKILNGDMDERFRIIQITYGFLRCDEP